jgi:hypothetical protein
VRAAAAVSFGVALIHGSVMAAHFREWWLYGVFFALVTPVQLLWALLVWRDRANRHLLLLGAALNLAVASIWATTRVVGVPFGPEKFRAEPVGFKDILATVDELVLAATVARALLRGSGRRSRSVAPWATLAWVFAAVSLLAASIAGSH